jgi:hypothetical protein
MEGIVHRLGCGQTFVSKAEEKPLSLMLSSFLVLLAAEKEEKSETSSRR